MQDLMNMPLYISRGKRLSIFFINPKAQRTLVVYILDNNICARVNSHVCAGIIRFSFLVACDLYVFESQMWGYTAESGPARCDFCLFRNAREVFDDCKDVTAH